MCGIAGVLSLDGGLPPPDLGALSAMARSLRHRGPDGLGAYRDARCGLAHARLAIVDPAGGAQPFGSEDGARWLCFNGEIFNHVELRAELAARGHRFRTRCDTEVLLAALDAWGEDALPRLDGQFAFALWDARARSLLLARDPFGILPLHVAEHGGRALFASEVRALFAGCPDLPRALDPEGLDDALTFWAPRAPRTAFRGVEELPPGHVRSYRDGARSERAWWRPRFPPEVEPFRGSLDDAAEAVRDALGRATRLRALRADVPVGSYLSGGLDSTLVSALALGARGGTLSTFSVGFESPEHDETVWQLLAAGRLGTDHRATRIGAADVAPALERAVLHAERPLLRTAPAPLHLLSGAVRDAGTKVVLTGEGADELFAGYDLFREGAVRRFWARAPGSASRPRLLERLYPYLARSPVAHRAVARQFFGAGLELAGAPGFAHATRFRTTSALKRLLAPDLRRAIAGRDAAALLAASLPDAFAGWHPLAQDQYLELATLLPGYLLSSQGDRQLMAHGVEGRFPFLSLEVAALAASLPPTLKLRGLAEKRVLKRAARGLVPDAISARTKQPYRAPGAAAVAAWPTPAIEAAVAPRQVAEAGIFDPEAVARLWAKCRRADGPLANGDEMALALVVSTQLLHARLVAARPDPGPPARFALVVDRARSGGVPCPP